MSTFLETLFDPGELVCLSQSVYGRGLMPVEAAALQSAQFQFFSINPLKDSRKDDNCLAFRNFLVEFDTVSLEEQLALIGASGIPFTSLVFSGSKSYHLIISLKEVIDRHHYNKLARWLYAALPLADQACKNPSRLSRNAGAIRESTGKLQELIELRGRIGVSELTDWLTQSKVPEPAPMSFISSGKFQPIRNLSGLTRRTRHFLEKGAAPGSRHHSLFAATCNLHRCGFTEKDILQKAKLVLDFEELPRFYRTVSEAIKVCIKESQSNK